MITAWWVFLLMVVDAFLFGIGFLYLKKASATLSKVIFRNLKNKNLFIGFFLFGLSMLIYLVALANGELSIIYPLASLQYVWTVFLSVKFLDEKMNTHKWIGIILIVLGVTVLGFGRA